MNVMVPLEARAVGSPDYVWWCPGCECAHGAWVSPGQPSRWDWNGRLDLPTLSPSVLVRSAKFTAKGQADYERWLAAGCPTPAPEFESAPTVCRSFIRDGVIEYLGDCTHRLAGQNVPMGPLSGS